MLFEYPSILSRFCFIWGPSINMLSKIKLKNGIYYFGSFNISGCIVIKHLNKIVPKQNTLVNVEIAVLFGKSVF